LLAAGCHGRSDAEPDASSSTPETEAAPPSEPSPGAAPAPADPEQQRADAEAVAVVRAWSAALNASDNAAAGELFAPEAVAIQGADVIPLPTAAAAAELMAALPCSGELIDVSVADNVVTATFELGDRPATRCDAAPGALAAAEFVVEDGRASWSGSAFRCPSAPGARARCSSPPRVLSECVR
jgi:hypothetical protein